jgi:hypothetical protein
MKIAPLIILLITNLSCVNQFPDSTSNKKMKQIDISDLGKSSEMLDEEKFWRIVSKSLINANGIYEQEERLINELTNLPPKDIIGFRLRTDKLLYDTSVYRTKN